MKILTPIFLFLFLHSAGQIQTIKIRRPPHINICGIDTGIVSVDTVLKYPVLKITPTDGEYLIKGYSARMNNDVHMSWWACKGDKFDNDLMQEISNTDRDKRTHLRIYDVIVIDNNKDTIKVNSIRILLQ